VRSPVDPTAASRQRGSDTADPGHGGSHRRMCSVHFARAPSALRAGSIHRGRVTPCSEGRGCAGLANQPRAGDSRACPPRSFLLRVLAYDWPVVGLLDRGLCHLHGHSRPTFRVI
jgi:hypothetical protein